jgi:type III secretion protein V
MNFPKVDKFTGLLKSSELLLGGMMVLATALLILPVPQGLVDILLAVNISLAMVLMLLSLQVGQALKVSAFPTMLLVTTLFRLSLNVSTTRLILLDGDAGEVVRSFGNFVVSGNPLVGGVVFLILTVVQFIVIAKGSERVAEVTARFTLDGMPGKQMSIDADLRSGAIDQEQAGRRRLRLERESQFFGAMDGAMKFVKGDAIAGIIITMVNIIGGLLVGTLQRGLSASQAVQTYTVLTIGDGLVSQIPALLISTAAGLVVTRVRSEKPSENLGRQMTAQLGAHPQVLLMAGSVLALLGIVPGMPTLAFGVLGLTLLLLGILTMTAKKRNLSTKRAAGSRSAVGVTLRLGEVERPDQLLDEKIDSLRRLLCDELGISIPRIEMQKQMPGRRWLLAVDDVPVASGAIERGGDMLLERVGEALRRSATRFIGVQEVQDMLDTLEKVQPALVREVVPRLVPPVLLSEILARLIEERVPIRNLRGILATLAEWARVEADPSQLAERVRNALAPLISYQVAPDGRLDALLLDPSIEQVIEQSLIRTETGTTLALAPEDGEAVLKGLDRALLALPSRTAVVLTRPEIRRPFWKLVCQTHPDVRVVSFLELDPGTSVQPAGKVSLQAA